MPLFQQLSKVDASEELDAMRRYFCVASIMLHQSGRTYDEANLAKTIIRLYAGGLSAVGHPAERAARIAEMHDRDVIDFLLPTQVAL